MQPGGQLSPAVDKLPFPELLRRWEGYMEVSGIAPRTRHQYRYYLVLFWCDWCAPRGL